MGKHCLLSPRACNLQSLQLPDVFVQDVVAGPEVSESTRVRRGRDWGAALVPVAAALPAPDSSEYLDTTFDVHLKTATELSSDH